MNITLKISLTVLGTLYISFGDDSGASFQGSGDDINTLCEGGVWWPESYPADLYDDGELSNFWQAFKPTLKAMPDRESVIGGRFAVILRRLNEVDEVVSVRPRD